MRHATRVFLAFVCTGCILGCTRAYRIDTYTADDGTAINRMLGNEIGVEGEGLEHTLMGTSSGEQHEIPVFTAEKRCFLDVKRSKGPGGNVTYYLLLSCTMAEPLDIETARSLTVIIDQESAVLTQEGDVRRVTDATSGHVTESLDYTVSPEFLRKIADAEEVRLIVSGRSGNLDGYFTETNFANFNRFVKEYVKDR